MSPPASRILFCFHDATASGASLWLRDFLRQGDFSGRETHAVLPTSSPMEASLDGAVTSCHTLSLLPGDTAGHGPGAMMRRLQNRLAAVGDYRRLMRRVGANLVYVNSSVQIAPMIAAWREGLPLLVHVREGWRSGWTFPLKRLAVRRLAQSVAFDASRGVALFGPPPSGRRWEVSPNGVGEHLLHAGKRREELRAEFGYTVGEKVFLFLGTLCQRKGVHDLMEVWPSIRRAHPEARLLLAGGADEGETHPAIRGLVQSPPEGVRYLGFSDRAVDLLALADYFVLPSYGEAMPISISEALMAGTPVIARAVGDVSFQIGKGRGFLFRGRGPEPLQRAMLHVLSHPEDVQRRARRGQEFARTRLVDREQYAQVLRLCDEAVLAGRPRQGGP